MPECLKVLLGELSPDQLEEVRSWAMSDDAELDDLVEACSEALEA